MNLKVNYQSKNDTDDFGLFVVDAKNEKQAKSYIQWLYAMGDNYILDCRHTNEDATIFITTEDIKKMNNSKQGY